MGYDVSAHPVDVKLIQDRLLPYVQGEGDIEDLLQEAVRLAQVRFRANAWGLGLVNLAHAEADEKRKKPTKKKTASKTTKKKKPTPKPTWLVPDAFDSDLHIWGRPFLITTPTERVSESIDRYLAATPKQVDKIAREMLYELNPELVDKVTPDTEGKLPTAKKLAEGLRFPLDFFKSAYPKLETGEKVELPNGEETTAKDLFLGSFGHHLMIFASTLQPGWMSRGYVWCTAYIGRAELDASDHIQSTASLFQPLMKEIKGYAKSFEPSITANYMLGGYVQPKQVTSFREWMEEHTEEMINACLDEGWSEEEARVPFQKIMEPLREAEYRKMGFLEATEIYSGFEGTMN